MTRRVRSFVSRHKIAVGAGSFIAIGLAIFVLLYFEPQALFLNKTVKEASPQAPASSQASPGASGSRSDPLVVASGSFRSLEHHTTGSVKLLRLADGSLALRLENLDTSNGPDLRVYLSRVPADRNARDYGRDFIDVGGLKGNRGSQNYAVPAGTHPSQFRSVVIWCKRFTVGFGVAPLG